MEKTTFGSSILEVTHPSLGYASIGGLFSDIRAGGNHNTDVLAKKVFEDPKYN